MTIIQLIYNLESGGAEKFVVNLSNQLSDNGHNVIICMLLDDSNPASTFNKQFLHPYVKFHSMKFSRGFSLKKVMAVHKYIKDQSPDVVHCHLNVIPYIFPTALFSRQIKFIHTIHNVAEKASGLKIQRNINRYFYKHNRITPITISKECQISFEKYYNLHNIHRIDNGCPTVEPTKELLSVQNEIKKLTKKGDFVFVHVARFHPAKNQQLLIDAFNQIYSKNKNFVLLILGRGFNSNEGKKLQQQSCPNIFFLGEKNNVGDYLLCANAFCLTSVYEGLPISLLEAMSCGITPICTAVGGITNVIINKENGYLAETSIESYTNAIKSFMGNVIDPNKIKQSLIQKYSMQTCASSYIDVYKD